MPFLYKIYKYFVIFLNDIFPSFFGKKEFIPDFNIGTAIKILSLIPLVASCINSKAVLWLISSKPFETVWGITLEKRFKNSMFC